MTPEEFKALADPVIEVFDRADAYEIDGLRSRLSIQFKPKWRANDEAGGWLSKSQGVTGKCAAEMRREALKEASKALGAFAAEIGPCDINEAKAAIMTLSLLRGHGLDVCGHVREILKTLSAIGMPVLPKSAGAAALTAVRELISWELGDSRDPLTEFAALTLEPKS